MVYTISMIRVGVVRGGISHLYDESLETGATVLKVLRDHFPSTYQAVDILITKDGTWHIGGRPISSADLVNSVDVIWNALHGEYGEDGALQASLEALQIPYTGSSAAVSALVHRSSLPHEKAEALGLRPRASYLMPDYRTQDQIAPEVFFKEHAQNIFLKFSPPWHIVPKTAHEIVAHTRAELLDGLRKAAEKPGDVLVREGVTGRPATVLVADNFRGKDVYTFIPRGVGLTSREKEALQRHAADLYSDLALRHYAEVGFIVHPKQTYLSHVHLMPVIRENAALVNSLHDVGALLPEFIDHILGLVAKNQK